ncbi:UDP-N-acetylmuramate dehydrogenase [Pseudactinotalea sp. Z1739]|uniref:UDP-N-acetylmuramate dehydrogenase n=1 Tax=Pseudactinotalea sp. Z1739 TaxID=3413028 RepID=UPI003C7CBADE
MTGTPSLAELTTLRVGGPVHTFVAAADQATIIETVRGADADSRPLLVLGGGSNILAPDAGFDGIVVQDQRTGVSVQESGTGQGVTVTVPAGQDWDGFVARAVAEGWQGVEALSGIPGSTGATPMQNVGAYGQEVSEVIVAVRTWDRAERRIRTLSRTDLAFDYRNSVLKESLYAPDSPWFPTPRYVVLQVQFQMVRADASAPIRYAELARTLGVAVGERVPSAQVREAVLALRRGKGMVLDADDHDTWSAGSFFTNPILDATRAAGLPPQAPRFDAGQGRVKTSAAWLIAQAGFDKGYGLPGAAALSTKHTLALTNRGGARAADLVALARTVRAGVQERFGVELVPEPVVLGGRL